ncbi:hypothetical protein Btru_068645 [Bulinus truncatus]|nr:hypothetical protein Btru_068645 [Bulinus truncatus]
MRMTSSSVAFCLLLLIGPSSFQNLTDDMSLESIETEDVPGMMSPSDSCIFEGLLCENLKNDSYFTDNDTLECSLLADVVTCYDLALNKCQDDVQNRALETSRDVAGQQYKLICESCHLEAAACGSLAESVGPHLNDSTHCSQLADAVQCYDNIIGKCTDAGERQLQEDSRSAVLRSLDLTCRPCHSEKTKCDQLVERSVVSVNDTKMCSRLADAIQCYDKAVNKCQGTEEIRAVNTSKSVAAKQFEFSCHTCVIEGMKCQKILEESSTSVNDNQVCSKLPAAILCYEKAVGRCLDSEARRGLETSMGVVEQQYDLDCE